jgi:rare lipoprotein A
MLWGKGRPQTAHSDFANGGKYLQRAVTSVALLLSCALFALPASAKTPGARYCFGGWCHRVSTLAQTETLVGWRGYLLASFYDDCRRDRLNPCGLTSSGAVFHPDLPDNAASPLFPDGTVILAYNPKTGDASVLRITNAGPYSGDRKLDISRAGAERLGFKDVGIAHLVVSVLKSPTIEEATYVRRRIYPSVPGHLGKFENFDQAYARAMERLGREQPPSGPSSAPFNTGGAPHRELRKDLILKPRPAVSPYFARELVLLRVPPRPVTRARPVSMDESTEVEPRVPSANARVEAPADKEERDFGFGLRKFIAGGPLMVSGGE